MKFTKQTYILSYSKEGWMRLVIGDNIYFYSLDAIFIPSIMRVYKRNKGKGIAQLRKRCTSFNKEK